ncbi:hypothetical protein A3L12_03335 [Thermococcus sp. P6]|uniref:hypothetical protein n=1 Tax=Thermococcus sp. P6 TaxID=122420 RepID=UPI000B5985A3|nr:hypothetical protein [Thermococcus sp. P6]ASJ10399.1 hypothetical protein A3L12_03335 [Thermococcus sp. P6]
MDEKEKILRRAYEFGYFVGYKGHTDWAGWVRERREELYSRASELGIYDLVKEAYARGKLDGAKKRAEEINEGLGETVAVEKHPGGREKAGEAGEAEEEFEEEFMDFLGTTKILLPPELLNTLKNLETPKMLRLGR